MTKPRPKSIEQIAGDARVASIEDEREHGSGWWVYLRPGYSDESGAHVVHGTAAEVRRYLAFVGPCLDGCDCRAEAQ